MSEQIEQQHPTPPGPPGPPIHTHEDGSRCMWVRIGDIDRWRQVSAAGWDLGPCPRHLSVWDASVAPGGHVCAVCGMPTESEPCAEHQPGAVD